MSSDTLTTEQKTQAGRTSQRVLWLVAGIVLVASLAWFLVGTKDMALIDRDEPMIAEVARQMVHRHEWLTPHLPAWPEKSIFKPPLAMWVIGASFKVLGVSELAARLPSVICSALVVTILFVVAGRRWGISAGLAGAGFMALPLLPAVAGRMALTDPLLMLLGTIALLCLEADLKSCTGRQAASGPHRTDTPKPAAERSFRGAGGGWWRNAVMWVALGLGMLIKGPAILAFFGPAVVIAADRFRWKPYLLFAAGMLLATFGGSLLLKQRHVPGMIFAGIGGLIIACSLVRWFVKAVRLPIGVLWGMPLMMATCGWWFAYIVMSGGAVHEASAKRFVLFEVLTRIARPMEHHWGPPGYYLAVALVGLLPFSALLPGLLGWSIRRRRRDSTVALLLAWVIGSWILCEISSTKLPHYILPAWPAMALLAAMWWHGKDHLEQRSDRKRAAGMVVPMVVFAVAVGGIGAFAWWAGRTDLLIEGAGHVSPRIACLGEMMTWQVGSLLLAAVLLGGTAVAAWLLARRRSLRVGVTAMAIGWMPALLVLMAAIMSRTPFSNSLSRKAAEQALALGGADSRYFAVGYTEPALFFYLPADRYERIKSARQTQSLDRTAQPFVLIASAKLDPAVCEWLGGRIAEKRSVSGINPARAQPETACVYLVEPVATSRSTGTSGG